MANSKIQDTSEFQMLTEAVRSPWTYITIRSRSFSSALLLGIGNLKRPDSGIIEHEA